MPEETSPRAPRLIEVAPTGTFSAPFAASREFTDAWWDLEDLDPPADRCYSAVAGSREVARILARERESGPDPAAWGIPELGATVQIVFFEIARSARRRGLGTAVIEQFTARHPGKWLMAFSEGADEFWNSLGWTRCAYRPDPVSHQPLFLRRPDGS